MPPGRWSVAGRRAGHTQPARDVDADAILAPNKAIKKVAKARQFVLFSTQNAGKKTVRGGSANDSRTPTACSETTMDIMKVVLLALMVWGSSRFRALPVDDGQVLCFHASSVVDSGDRRPPHPLPGVSLPAVPASGLRRPALVFISRTPNPGKIPISHFPRVCVVVRSVVETTRFCNRTRLSFCR